MGMKCLEGLLALNLLVDWLFWVPSKIWQSGWGGRDRTYECRNQNPVPYHLATPQFFNYTPSNRAWDADPILWLRNLSSYLVVVAMQHTLHFQLQIQQKHKRQSRSSPLL